MTSFVGSALFYPVSYASAQLLDLVRGVIDPTLLDTVEFTDESGGVAVRQLALPRLPGIDEVEVTQATLQFGHLRATWRYRPTAPRPARTAKACF